MNVQETPAKAFISRGQLRLLAFAVLFLGLSALTPYLIYSQLDAQLPSLDGRWLSFPFMGACALLLVAYFSFDGLRLYYILRSLGYRVPLRALGPLVFINIFVSNITPMATGGGVAQIWYLKRYGVPIGAGTAATSLRTLQAVLYIFIPAPFLVLLIPELDNPLGSRGGMYLAAFGFLYLAFFSLLLLRLRWIMGLIDLVLAPLARFHVISTAQLGRWRFRIRREMLGFSRAFFGFFRGAGLNAYLSMLFTLLFLISLFSFPALLLWGLGYNIDYWTSIGLLLITTFVMYFAPTPGASGVAEGAFGLFFANLVESGDLVLTIVAWRFLTIHLGMLLGLPLTLRAMATARKANAH